MSNIIKLFSTQILEVDLSDTLRIKEGVQLPVSYVFDKTNAGRVDWFGTDCRAFVNTTTPTTATLIIEIANHRTTFELVLKSEDKTSPVEALASDTTTVYKTEEAIMKKHIASLYSRVTNLEKDSKSLVSDEALASKTPNYSIFGPKILYSDTEIQSIGPKIASDSKTVQVDYTKAEQGVRIRSLERIEKVLTEQILTLNHHKQEQESKIDNLEQEINALKSAIKHLNSKTDKILKLIFKD